ncbi:hypothetical protein TNCV_2146491 [Trichonephila clavipes]|uniref:Uncharacterized protein n=1 Tax=Trichonephila clavipes TaxID=2585209 RepID=A0A8X6T4F4_TRICX|nr:hypothetical protein TNCV_2146491 [Trichonephila clavipes]
MHVVAQKMPRETLASVGVILRYVDKEEAASRLRLTTGNEFLGVYLNWFDLAVVNACSLYSHSRIDGNHLI